MSLSLPCFFFVRDIFFLKGLTIKGPSFFCRLVFTRPYSVISNIIDYLFLATDVKPQMDIFKLR